MPQNRIPGPNCGLTSEAMASEIPDKEEFDADLEEAFRDFEVMLETQVPRAYQPPDWTWPIVSRAVLDAILYG